AGIQGGPPMSTRSLVSLAAVTALTSIAHADPTEYLKASATVTSELQLRPNAAAALATPLSDRPGVQVSMLVASRTVKRFWVSLSEHPDQSNAEVTEIVVGVMSVNVPGCMEADSWG